MSQKIPEYTEKDFERILLREFPNGEAEEARKVLQAYGKESYQSWPLRVHIACLKLARGDISSLRKYVKAACGDPRDVLLWAEYSRSWNAKGSMAKAQASADDWKELQEWIARVNN